MTDLSVSLVASPLTQPVLDGAVPIDGVTAKTQAARSVNTNSTEMLELTYDVAEMSLATFTKAREMGIPLVALPIFPGRRFTHNGVQVAVSAGIRDLSELRGRRVGLPQFWMTSSVWHRLVLRQAHGVSQAEVSWVTTAPERMGSLGLPSEAHLDTSGRNPRELLLAGEIDAIMGPGGGGGPAEGRGEGGGGRRDDRIASPFADQAAAQRGYYEQTGILPIVHLIVMKEELAKQDPSLVGRLCNTFEKAKDEGLAAMLEEPATRPISGLSLDENRALFGDDPWQYGVGPNRKVLELFLSDVTDQGLTSRQLGAEELFAPGLPTSFQ